MKAFAYRSAQSEDEACKLLGESALALAGGTSLLNLMKSYVLQPDALINLKSIPGLDKIEAAGGGLKLGANLRLADILAHESLAREYPALHQAADRVASPQIRNMGTLGGNLCQRPSCWYFTHEGFDCLKRGGATCPAKEGENEYHAIFGNDGPCVMVHPSSLAPSLIALGAKVRIASPAGPREIALEDFFTSPKANVKKENVLAPNELLTHVLLPGPGPKSAYYAVREKEANDRPLTLAAVSLTLSGGVCQEARICLGYVAPMPWRAKSAEAALKGKAITAETAAAAADLAVEGAVPLGQNAYKVKAAHTSVKRAILLAATGKF